MEQLFADTDVDYFGPLLVKLNKKTQTNQAILQHGSIFWSSSSHALCIWLAGDLSTDSFNFALCRFTFRTGYPKSITNDNEIYFVSAQQEPSKALQKLGFSRIKDFSKIKNISCGNLIHCLLYGWLLRGRPWWKRLKRSESQLSEIKCLLLKLCLHSS